MDVTKSDTSGVVQTQSNKDIQMIVIGTHTDTHTHTLILHLASPPFSSSSISGSGSGGGWSFFLSSFLPGLPVLLSSGGGTDPGDGGR